MKSYHTSDQVLRGYCGWDHCTSTVLARLELKHNPTASRLLKMLHRQSTRPKPPTGINVSNLISSSQHLIYYSAPIQAFGRKAKIVPVTAMIEEMTIKTQFRNLSAGGISFPKILRWNRRGRITQIMKHKHEPINAMMLSKAGKIIEIMTKMIIIVMRTTIFRIPRPKLEHPINVSLSGTTRASRPISASIVATIGLAFKGSFVRGMMAMKTQSMTVNDCGYPAVPIRLEVTESRTPSPYMR